MARTGQREQVIFVRGDIVIEARYEQQFPAPVILRLHDAAKGPVELSLRIHMAA
jgi:hypothetical protein